MQKIYTDGACSGNGTERALAGIGIYFGPTHANNYKGPVPGLQTNQRAELYAIHKALHLVDPAEQPQIDLYTDSKYATQILNSWWKKWQEEKREDYKHKDLIDEIKQRQTLFTSVTFTWIPRAKNKEADALSKAAISEQRDEPPKKKLKKIPVDLSNLNFDQKWTQGPGLLEEQKEEQTKAWDADLPTNWDHLVTHFPEEEDQQSKQQHLSWDEFLVASDFVSNVLPNPVVATPSLEPATQSVVESKSLDCPTSP